MNLKAVFLTQRIKESSLYYITKLCVHHFTFYNLATKYVVGYACHEGEGALTANKFHSCVADFLAIVLNFHDAFCIAMGALKNFTLAKTLLHFAVIHTAAVEQSSLKKGLTQMEVDSVHGCDKRHLKTVSIYIPAQ